MFTRDSSKVSFLGVAMFIIIAGAAIFAFGLVTWLYNFFGTTSFFMPSLKVIGGLVVLALGYIILEIELIRTKK